MLQARSNQQSLADLWTTAAAGGWPGAPLLRRGERSPAPFLELRSGSGSAARVISPGAGCKMLSRWVAAGSRGAASSEASGSCAAVPWGQRGEPFPRSPSRQDSEEEHQRTGATAVSTTAGCESPKIPHAPREGLAERRDRLHVPCQRRAAGQKSPGTAFPRHPSAVMAPWGRGDPWRGRERGALAAREVCCGKRLAGKAGANETSAWQESWQQGSAPPSTRGFSPACGLLLHPQPFATPKHRVRKPSPLQHPIL